MIYMCMFIYYTRKAHRHIRPQAYAAQFGTPPSWDIVAQLIAVPLNDSIGCSASKRINLSV